MIPSLLRRSLRVSARAILHPLGLDLVRLSASPKETLGGVKGLEIRTIVDCGANRGQFARYISDFFPRASIYCFEPLDEPFRDLADWAETQGDRIICHKLALGDENGEVTMHHHVEHSPSSSLLNTTQHVERLFPKTREQRELRVPVATLNKVLAPASRIFGRDFQNN